MLLFSSIVEYRVFVYTCVFLNRIAIFENKKIITTSVKIQFLLKMVDSRNKKQTDHAQNNCKNIIWPTVFAILSLLVCLVAYANSQQVFTIIVPLIAFNNVQKI